MSEGQQLKLLGSVSSGSSAGETALQGNVAVSVESLSLYYGQSCALKNINLELERRRVAAFVGPSGCGKSALLRCFNRLNDLIDDCRIEGDVVIEGESIYGSGFDIPSLRRRVGMVFQKPNPFPRSIYENVAYGLRLQGNLKRSELDEQVESALCATGLWDEVKHRLKDSALALSGGQQQRLIIARAIAVEPQILLLDEPCSALDPTATLKIEELIYKLKDWYTIVMVTHNLRQAARMSDTTAFFYQGELVEIGDTAQIFREPGNKLTEAYITDRYGHFKA